MMAVLHPEQSHPQSSLRFDVKLLQRGIFMRITIDNVSLSVEVLGQGDPALVFLHYWGGTHRTWNAVISELLSDYQVVTYDMRGWGQSGAARDGYSIGALANEAMALVKQLGLSTYVLVGHSMGGKVAQLVASRRPEGLMGLVLVAPATPTPAHMPDQAKQEQMHAYDNRETVLQTISFLCARTPSAELIEQIVEDSLSGTAEAKLAWPTEGMAEDISVDVAQIAVPTLVLAGEMDRLDSVDQHRKEVIARIEGSQMEIITGSGHLLPIDEPLQTAHAIRRFVSQLSPRD